MAHVTLLYFLILQQLDVLKLTSASPAQHSSSLFMHSLIFCNFLQFLELKFFRRALLLDRQLSTINLSPSCRRSKQAWYVSLKLDDVASASLGILQQLSTYSHFFHIFQICQPCPQAPHEHCATLKNSIFYIILYIVWAALAISLYH